MFMNWMKIILLCLILVKFKMAYLNLDDDFVLFLSLYINFFSKWKGRKYFFHIGKHPV